MMDFKEGPCEDILFDQNNKMLSSVGYGVAIISEKKYITSASDNQLQAWMNTIESILI